jgi:trehalose 6-phosphate synthase/phosphatase
MEQLIIVSNRLPVKIEKKVNSFEVRMSSGGLVSALSSLFENERFVKWIGVADFKPETWKSYKEINPAGTEKIEPLFINKSTYQLYYNGFSNTVIWPLFHYFPSYAEYIEGFYQAYKEVNQSFAKSISEVAKSGATVWIHDYHLMLLPKLLRELRPDLTIGFFLHIPFPSYEILKHIPNEWRSEILQSLICSDTVGFHISEYVTHFKRSIGYFLGQTISDNRILTDDRVCLIKQYPISVDFEKFNSSFNNDQVVKGRNLIRQKNKQTKIIFSVDRLDYTKGVINRLQAFESFLHAYPQYREKVVFVINVVPSRDEISKYVKRKKLIEENIGRINGLYGNIHWQPIIYQYRHLTFSQLNAFYTAADIALVTPLRDGMNLVAKEFVASRKDLKGVLVLSEFAGAAAELTEAILVNPNDIQSMKQGLLEALDLTDDEQKSRMSKMQGHLRQNDIIKWLNATLGDLQKAKKHNVIKQPSILSFDEKNELIEKYRKSKRRLLLLDYDGTLTPYCTRPKDAVPSNALLENLKELALQPENHVVLISGRQSQELDRWFSGCGISLISEHGAAYKLNHEEWKTVNNTKLKWEAVVEDLFKRFCLQYPDTFIERKEYSIAFHYRALDAKSSEKLKTELSREILMLDVSNYISTVLGSRVIEVKSAGIDKGTITSTFLRNNTYDFILGIGDDTTDEDMFAVLADHDAYSIKVGITPTLAKRNLIGVSNVLSLLNQLSNIRSNAFVMTASVNELPKL